MSQLSRNSSEDENLLESQERHVTRLRMSKMAVMKRVAVSLNRGIYLEKEKYLPKEK